MSTQEHEPRLDGDQAVSQSKIKLVRNAKGDPQWEITVVEGADAAELDRIRGIALAQFQALLGDFFGS